MRINLKNKNYTNLSTYSLPSAFFVIPIKVSNKPSSCLGIVWSIVAPAGIGASICGVFFKISLIRLLRFNVCSVSF